MQKITVNDVKNYQKEHECSLHFAKKKLLLVMLSTALDEATTVDELKPIIKYLLEQY